MKLSCLYDLAIKLGSERDPRNNIKIKSYADTAVLYGEPDTEVRRILVGIDIGVGELLLADKIRKEEGLDLVIAHHPEGNAWLRLSEVMQLQTDILTNAGVPERVARALLDERTAEVERRILPNNHMRSVDAARLLNLPFICIHTPADNHAFSFIKYLIHKEKPRRVQDIIELLMGITEYKEASKELVGPKIILGHAGRRAGKILVEMTGGTEGPKEVFEKLYKAGIRTLVSMHLSEEHFKKVKDANINAVIAGHISSDTLGLNLLLDRIEKETREKIQVIDCSGFRRISRN